MPPPFDRVTPPCPKCHRADLVEDEDQNGSSSRWFICARCGVRYTTPPPLRP